MKKNIFKILFAILLFLGISGNVDAADSVSTWTTTGTISQSISGRYVTIEGKGEINFTGNTEIFIIISEDADVTINLNGYTLTTNDYTNSHLISNKGKLTINGEGTIINKANNMDWGTPVLANHPGATMILNGGTYTRSKNGKTSGNSGYIVKNLGTLIIEEDVIMNNGDTTKGSSLISSGWDIAKPGEDSNLYYDIDESVEINVIINGGTFTGGKRAFTSDPGDNTVINGGKFSDGASGIVKSAGKVLINGGEFTAVDGKSILEIEGEGSIEVVNGEFNQDVSSYMSVDSESIKNDDGTYIVNFVYADYSKIDEIIEKVIDEGVDTYTKESITALEKELEKVDWELGKSKQADVDKMADDVTKAFNQLKKIENPKTGNGIVTYVISAIIMILGIGGCIIYRKKLFN